MYTNNSNNNAFFDADNSAMKPFSTNAPRLIDRNEQGFLGNSPPGEEKSHEMPLMEAANNQLEAELAEIKNNVRRLLKELVEYQTEANQIHEQWAPLQAAEHQETERLDELQTEVQDSVVGEAMRLTSTT